MASSPTAGLTRSHHGRRLWSKPPYTPCTRAYAHRQAYSAAPTTLAVFRPPTRTRRGARSSASGPHQSRSCPTGPAVPGEQEVYIIARRFNRAESPSTLDQLLPPGSRGRSLAYVSYRQCSRTSSWPHLESATRSTGGQVQNFAPAFSPDGKRIVYSSSRTEHDAGGDADGTNSRIDPSPARTPPPAEPMARSSFTLRPGSALRRSYLMDRRAQRGPPHSVFPTRRAVLEPLQAFTHRLHLALESGQFRHCPGGPGDAPVRQITQAAKLRIPSGRRRKASDLLLPASAGTDWQITWRSRGTDCGPARGNETTPIPLGP